MADEGTVDNGGYPHPSSWSYETPLPASRPNETPLPASWPNEDKLDFKELFKQDDPPEENAAARTADNAKTCRRLAEVATLQVAYRRAAEAARNNDLAVQPFERRLPTGRESLPDHPVARRVSLNNSTATQGPALSFRDDNAMVENNHGVVPASKTRSDNSSGPSPKKKRAKVSQETSTVGARTEDGSTSAPYLTEDLMQLYEQQIIPECQLLSDILLIGDTTPRSANPTIDENERRWMIDGTSVVILHTVNNQHDLEGTLQNRGKLYVKPVVGNIKKYYRLATEKEKQKQRKAILKKYRDDAEKAREDAEKAFQEAENEIFADCLVNPLDTIRKLRIERDNWPPQHPIAPYNASLTAAEVWLNNKPSPSEEEVKEIMDAVREARRDRTMRMLGGGQDSSSNSCDTCCTSSSESSAGDDDDDDIGGACSMDIEKHVPPEISFTKMDIDGKSHCDANPQNGNGDSPPESKQSGMRGIAQRMEGHWPAVPTHSHSELTLLIHLSLCVLNRWRSRI